MSGEDRIQISVPLHVGDPHPEPPGVTIRVGEGIHVGDGLIDSPFHWRSLDRPAIAVTFRVGMALRDPPFATVKAGQLRVGQTISDQPLVSAAVLDRL